MKSLVTLLITVFASAAFAGGSGGGGVMMNNFMARPDRTFDLGGAGGLRPGAEIVFHMGQENGFIKFAYGRLIENKWQIEKHELPTKEIINEEEVISALELSKSMQNWAPIK